MIDLASNQWPPFSLATTELISRSGRGALSAASWESHILQSMESHSPGAVPLLISVRCEACGILAPPMSGLCFSRCCSFEAVRIVNLGRPAIGDIGR